MIKETTERIGSVNECLGKKGICFAAPYSPHSVRGFKELQTNNSLSEPLNSWFLANSNKGWTPWPWMHIVTLELIVCFAIQR